MLKFHEADDLFFLEVDGDDITATIPGGLVQAGHMIRLIAPSKDLDGRVKVTRSERVLNRHGDIANIEGKLKQP